jgi:hypothetical protein
MPSGVVGDFAAFVARAVRLLVSVLALYLSFFYTVIAVAKALTGDGEDANTLLATLGPLVPLVAIAILFLLYVLSTAVHELGHAVAARLVGWRVHVIAVGAFGYRPHRKRFERNPNPHPGDRWGWVLATPPIGSDWDTGRATVFLGGVAANMLCAAICSAAMATLPLSLLPYGLIEALAVISFAMAISNLIPCKKPRPNDGAVVLDLVAGKRTSQFEADSAWLASYVLDGVDRDLWDPELLHRLETDTSAKPLQDAVLLGRYLALGDVVRAHALLENSALVHDGADSSLVFNRAFLVAIVERDALKASMLLDQVPRNERGRSYLYWRARMTIRAVGGEVEGAREAAARARVFARKEGSVLDGDEIALLEACESGAQPPTKFGREMA